jgi:hypothetical protein
MHAGATIVDNFRITGNSLGGQDWDGRSGEWYTGTADGGMWEDISCGARFKSDLNWYLQTAGTHYKSVQACSLTKCLFLTLVRAPSKAAELVPAGRRPVSRSMSCPPIPWVFVFQGIYSMANCPNLVCRTSARKACTMHLLTRPS